MSSPSTRPTFTKAQLAQYFTYINLPTDIQSQLTSTNPPPSSSQLSLLQHLLIHQLSHIPFENLDLHYAPVKGISLNAAHLFHKYIERNAGRGGYCMQNNSFFATVLRSLGYVVMSAGARVASNYGNPELEGKYDDLNDVAYGAFTHQVNIVTIEGKRYVVDVGFGGAGPTIPVPLEHEFTAIQMGSENHVSASLMLTRGFTGNNTSRNREQAVWRYTIKYSAASDYSKPWIPIYCFSEMEFMPHDFELSSSWVSTNRNSIFVNKIMVQRFLVEEGKLVGEVTVNDRWIKKRTRGNFMDRKDVMECKSEKERVERLESLVGIRLSEEEVEGIRGYHTEIK